MKKTNTKGQALFEVVIALGVAILIIVAVISASINSIKNSDSSKNVNVATRYSQEATEWLRGQRDLSWTVFLTKASSGGTIWCLNSDPPTFQSSVSTVTLCQGSSRAIPGTIFNRYVTLTILDPSPGPQNIIQADVVTYWTDSQGSHFAPSTTKFTNWFVTPACLGRNTSCSPSGTPCCTGLNCGGSNKCL